MVVIERKKDEKIENQLSVYEQEYLDTKAGLSDIRKKGKDTRIPEMLMLDFAPLVKMARVTYELEDVDRVKRLLERIRAEIKECKEASDYELALDAVKEAYQFIRQGEWKSAQIAYNNLRRLYKRLAPDLQRTLYLASLDIHKKIEDKGGE